MGDRCIGMLPPEFGPNPPERLHQRFLVGLAIHRKQVGDAVFLRAFQLQHRSLAQLFVEVFWHMDPPDGAALVFHPNRAFIWVAVQGAQGPGQIVGELLRARLGMGVEISKRRAEMTGHALQIQRPLLLGRQRVDHVSLGCACHATEHYVRPGRLKRVAKHHSASLVAPLASRHWDLRRAQEPIDAARTHAATPTVHQQGRASILSLEHGTRLGGQITQLGANQFQAQVHRRLLAFLLVRGPHAGALFVSEQRKRHRPRQVACLKFTWGAHVQHHAPLLRRSQERFGSHDVFWNGHGCKDASLEANKKRAPQEARFPNKPRTLVKVLNQSLWRTQTLLPEGLHWARDAQQLWSVAWRSRRKRL